MFFLVEGVGRKTEGRGVNTVGELVEIRVQEMQIQPTCYYFKIMLQIEMPVLVFPFQ